MKKLALAILICVQTNGAAAQPYQWEPLHPQRDYWITGSLSVAAIAAHSLVPSFSREWIAPSSVDENVRNALRLTTYEGRRSAATWSDVTLALTLSLPVGLDAVGLAGIRDDNWSSAAQILNIDLQAFALTGLLSATTKALVGRERPYARACRLDPSSDPECQSLDEKDAYKSFFSGHAAFSFTAAGLACLHHKELKLFGEPGDSAVCAGALILATATSVLRISADKHYFSDVTTGALIGIASGVVFPKLLHSVQKDSKPTANSYFVPTAGPSMIGLSHVHFF